MNDGRYPPKHGAPKGEEYKKSSTSNIRQKLEGFKNIGLSKISGEDLVNIAQEMGKTLKDRGLKTTQIRKFLDGMRKLEVQFKKGKDFNADSVILLKPKLAYAAGRNPEVRPLMDILEPAITAAGKTYQDFTKLLSLVEAIVAYHKFYGGSD